MRRLHGQNHGFTLIELSIVLVIIGLIIGGVLVGQDLVKAAATRAQIAQIEKYNSAVNAFKTKYNGIPGDLIYTDAATFGFTVGTGCDGHAAGYRDGNGLIDGVFSPNQLTQGEGETELFWSDLSTSGFLDSPIPNGGGPLIYCGNATPITSVTIISEYIPTAKIGGGNYIYAYEVGGYNWFGLAAITGLGNAPTATTTLTVAQAYNIDAKIDDGLPTTGTVQATYIHGSQSTIAAVNAAITNSSDSCYNTTSNTYSTPIKNGSGPNCALSFQMQGAAR